MKKLLTLLLITISFYSYGQDTLSTSDNQVKYDIIKSYAGTSYNVVVKEISAKHLAFCFEGETAINYISSQEYIDVTLSNGRIIKGQPRITYYGNIIEVDDITETFGLIELEGSISGESKGEYSTYSDARDAAIEDIKKQAFEKGCHMIKIFSEIGSKGMYAYNITILAKAYKFKDDLR